MLLLWWCCSVGVGVVVVVIFVLEAYSKHLELSEKELFCLFFCTCVYFQVGSKLNSLIMCSLGRPLSLRT